MINRWLAFFGVLCLSIYLYACGGTEVIKNPEPITWGEITFAPETIEKSSSNTVWNNVSFSGYNKKGIIQKVSITEDEVIIENIKSDFYNADLLKLGKVSGEYKSALAFIMSGELERATRDGVFSEMPDVKVGSYASQNGQLIMGYGAVSSASANYDDLSFQTVGKGESKNIVIAAKGEPEIRIAEFSCGKIFIPENIRDNPEGLVLDSLRLSGISVPDLDASIKNLGLDYGDKKFTAALTGIKIPSASLDDLNIQNFPEFLEGDFQGKGSLTGQKIRLDASLDLKNLLDATCDLAGSINNSVPDSLNFTLKDMGILRILTQEQKAQLGFLALIVPNGGEALAQFLSRPGQTMEGKITFSNGNPQFNLQVK